MIVLVLGLVLFLGAHSLPMVPTARAAVIARLGDNGHKGLHSLAAAAGIGLIVWGFGLARWEGAPLLWQSPPAMRWVAVVALVPVFPLILAAFLPGRIGRLIAHPMLTGVTLWAFAHLLFVGSAPGVALFASFLVWGLADRRSLIRRGAGRTAPPLPPFGRGDALAVGLGLALWLVTVTWSHLFLFGVSPLG
ncbi:NnrU family protein [Siculibacillus lacustris]|uniref:NnrU family protein n=1 Tax=Siculibacillus lacustris TaxID=1549641 RepID=A0A4Q9VVH4_9HYPH|nr:NnrU family protein [Siculibacillus lacustris]TBW39807.1 NnrU family protein [Siculibacillus lacustris]